VGNDRSKESTAALSLAGPGDRCALDHNDADPWTWGQPLPQRYWRVTTECSVAFAPYEPGRYAFGRLQPGDRLRYETTFWFEQGCCNEPHICDRFVVLSGALAGHCVSTRGMWEPDRSMLEPLDEGNSRHGDVRTG
jgi:hypothetical protein